MNWLVDTVHPLTNELLKLQNILTEGNLGYNMDI